MENYSSDILLFICLTYQRYITRLCSMKDKSRLLHNLNMALNERKVDGKYPRGFIAELHKGSGVEYETVRSIVSGNTKDPSASVTEALLVYFKRMPKFKGK